MKVEPSLHQNNRNSIKKTGNKELIKKMKFYCNNLLKLLDQESEWSNKRLINIHEGNWDKANEIDDKFLKPLEKKIQSLAKIAYEDLSSIIYKKKTPSRSRFTKLKKRLLNKYTIHFAFLRNCLLYIPKALVKFLIQIKST